ncbi:MAG TPA: hypothetical protein VE978_02195 [Chitinophagales bacterium]|nr:hypothetical protein [Chitinophagales bacterium]
MKSRNVIQLINHSNGESEVVKFLFFAWHHKWMFAVCLLAIFTISFWYFTKHPHYSATARFSANSLKQEILNRNEMDVQVNEDPNKIISNFFSDEAVDTIRKKFFHSTRYMDTLRIAELKSQIANNIVIKSVQFGNYELTVKSGDRFRCADIANELVNQVQQISRRQEQQLLHQRIDIITQVAQSAKAPLSKSDLENLLASIDDEFKKLNASDRESPYLKQLQSHVALLSDSLQAENNALNKMKLANEVILERVNENSFPSITLIQKALPDHCNYTLLNAGYSLIIAITVLALLPFLIYVFATYR